MLYKKGEPINQVYDVVIIGSGLGGLTAANMLGRAGRRVLLLESHNKLGGLATWFRRKDRHGGEHIFDISLHGFPYGMVKTCKKYWGQAIASKIERIDKVRFLNPQFDVETDFTREDYIRILVEHFKVPIDVALGFFNDLENMNFYDAPNICNGDLFKKYFSDRNDIVRFLLEPITYANGSTLEDPAITYGIVFSNFMQKGVYIFKGGTDLMISLMKEELLRNNVDIRLHSKVDKIEVENAGQTPPQVKSVLCGNEKIKCHAVISNSNLLSTIFNLVGEQNFDKQFVQEARKVRINTSSCQVYMGIKAGESIPPMGDLIFYSEAEEFSTEMLLSPKVLGQTFSLYYPDSRPQRGKRYAVVSSSNARYQDWQNLSSNEYQQKKAYLIEKALSALEKIIPGVREKIDYTEAATPLTIEKYTHHRMGSSFGTKFEGLEISKRLPAEVKGLYHAGSVGIIMSGWLGAANYGVIQSHAVNTYLDTVSH